MQVHQNLQALPTWQKSVLTIGSFDGVHNGHRAILAKVVEEARAIGGESILITFEPHPRLVLGGGSGNLAFYLLNSLEEKIDLLTETGLDHLVVVPFTKAFSDLSAEAYLREFLEKFFQPHTIFIGYDHRYGNDRSGGIEQMRAWAEGSGTLIKEISAQEIDNVVISSTQVRQAVQDANMELAEKWLGAPYRIAGEVIRGDQIGQTIGYPTANLAPESEHKLLPPPGIYACDVATATSRNKGLLYIGTRPTLQGQQELRVEVHLLDFSGNLYGQRLSVDVRHRIRGDLHLTGLEALKQQIAADEQAARAWFAERVRLDVAIVILNYNTARHLATYLPSVKAHSVGVRIVVADNGSPDHSVEYLKTEHPEIEVIDLKKNYGFAGGYNEALKYVKAKYYVILNSDVEVTSGWLDAPIRLLDTTPDVAIVQPKIKAWRQKTHFEYAGAAGGWLDALGYPFCRGRIFTHTESDQGQYDTEQECFWAAGAAFFIRADLYHCFEGFDADYFAHNEEIDLCWRIKRAGYRVICTPDSVVYHLGGGTLEYESPRKTFLNFRNSLFTLLKNASTARLLWAIPTRLVLDGVAGLRFIAKGQWRATWAIVQAHFSFYANFSTMLAKRRTIRSLVERHAISPKENLRGMTQSSIVWRFYVLGKKRFGK